MKELEKIEKVLFENIHVLHYADEYKNVAGKIHKKVFEALENERDELKKENKKWKEDNDVWMKTSLADITESNTKLLQELQTLKDKYKELLETKTQVHRRAMRLQQDIDQLEKERDGAIRGGLIISKNFKRDNKKSNEVIQELRKFIKWYSGMEQQKIDSAFQRFIKETNSKN